jgi:hypothetical protein
MPNENTKILKELETNSEMGLVQGEKMIAAVDGLEPIMEGVLMKTNELVEEQKKTNELLSKEEPKEEVQKVQIMGVEIVTIKGEKGDKGDEPSDDRLVEIITPLIPEPIKGDSPTRSELIELIEPLIPAPIKGDDGDTYVLTEKDKQDIASSIEVPVVEKVVERTEVIKEVASLETPTSIKEKLLKEGLSYEELSDLPDIEHIVSFYSQASKTGSLVELDDVDYSGLSFVNGKYVLGSGGGGGVTSFNTLTGAVTISAGSNITLTPAGNNIEIASTGGGGTPGGSDKSVQVNNAGVFDGDTLYTYDLGTEVVQIPKIKVVDDTYPLELLDFSGTISIATFGGDADASNEFADTALYKLRLPEEASDKVALIDATYYVKSDTGSDLTVTSGAISVVSASDTVAGKVELAIVSEVNTGSDNTRATTPDSIAGSYAGTKNINRTVFAETELVTTGDGKAYIYPLPAELNGMNLVSVAYSVAGASSSGSVQIQIARGRQANATTAPAYVDVLSTVISVDANEYKSTDAGTPPVIDTANDDVATGDVYRIDCVAAGTGTLGGAITLGFRLP